MATKENAQLENFVTTAKFSWKIARLKNFSSHSSPKSLNFKARMYDASGKLWVVLVSQTNGYEDRVLSFSLQPEDLEGSRYVVCTSSLYATDFITKELKILSSRTFSQSLRKFQRCTWEAFPKLVIRQNPLLRDSSDGILRLSVRVGRHPDDLCHFEDNNQVLADHLNLLRSGIAHDATFIVEDQHFPAHRQVLLSHSEVFKRMFENKMKESATRKIVITDAKAEVFNLFLQFLYTGAYPKKFELHAVPLFALADKYQVKSLEGLCIAHFQTVHLDYNSAKILLCLSYKHLSLMSLLVRLVQYLAQNLDFLDSDAWKEVVDESPRAAIELLRLYAKFGFVGSRK